MRFKERTRGNPQFSFDCFLQVLLRFTSILSVYFPPSINSRSKRIYAFTVGIGLHNTHVKVLTALDTHYERIPLLLSDGDSSKLENSEVVGNPESTFLRFKLPILSSCPGKTCHLRNRVPDDVG